MSKYVITIAIMLFTVVGLIAQTEINSSKDDNGDKAMLEGKMFYDFTATTIDGKEMPMSEYKGKVVLVVNVASKCGFTPQYEGLQALYAKYEKDGFVILGFPSNQFANQEPGTDADIQEFCTLNYGVTFPMFSKIDVNGKNAHPLYKFLKAQQSGFPGDAIKWNFTKFLIDPKGNVVNRFATTTKPESLDDEIASLLKK